jgi:putative flippase GtrA
MVEKTKSLVLFLYAHSFVRYVAVGGTTFMIDFGVLVLLHGVLKVNVLIAASISYWLSILFNFLVNRFWTFSANEKSELGRHVAFYLVLLGFNYLFTIAFLAFADHIGLHYTVGKIIAVAIQMSWTYVIYKKVIFR